MDLRSGRPFWPVRQGLGGIYPPLSKPVDCDVVVVGSGITGALIAWRLVEAGLSTIIIDRRDCSMGSTAASTAVIQYEIDTPLGELAQLIGEKDAVLSYQAGRNAIATLANIDAQIGNGGGLRPRRSLYLCSKEDDQRSLREEYELRQKHGFTCEWWTREQLSAESDLDAIAAIVTPEAADLNPYAFTHALLSHACHHGLRIFDRTALTSWTTAKDHIILETDRGVTLKPRFAILAGGFETTTFLDEQVAKLISTYAFVSEPITQWNGWPRESVIWETARPYIYARQTEEDRLIFGGEDLPFKHETVRDHYLPKKTDKLVQRAREMFPRIDFEVAFCWAGTFAETDDGLPYISEHPQSDRMLLAMCYGGNGITYSVIAAEICRDIILGEDHPMRKIFSLARRERTKRWSLFG
ncbi:FAD-binding oxidoreductase [bacterium]|nr:FAD-binding oxidoreductase [bacterium]